VLSTPLFGGRVGYLSAILLDGRIVQFVSWTSLNKESMLSQVGRWNGSIWEWNMEWRGIWF